MTEVAAPPIAGLTGLRVVTFESRMAGAMADLISRQGEPLSRHRPYARSRWRKTRQRWSSPESCWLGGLMRLCC